ncbi:MAG TPA: hypothetical protein DDY86_03980 [Syntrophaceae bacterium]|nr:hypothetical protein [Syntrophaceae bacterium]
MEPPAASDKNIHPLFTSSEKFESDLNHFAKIQYDAGFAEGFAAGRREQARVDAEVMRDVMCGQSMVVVESALAALAAVAPEAK